MACVLILRSQHVGVPDNYYLEGTGWQSLESAASSYASKEASLVDGETQRELLGPGALLLCRDLVAGVEYPIPVLEQ
jgi:hypothetical protein